MIVRIMGEGQFEVDEARLEELNRFDGAVLLACEQGDQGAFTTALEGLLTAVRTTGKGLPDDYLGPSDLVLPGPDATIDEVRELLGDEGLIPG